MDQKINGNEKDKKKWQNLFFMSFLDEMKKAGYSSGKMSRFVWKPFLPEELVMTGPERDRNFSEIEVDADKINGYLKQASNLPNTTDYFQSQKLALVIFPGFMHHMQKYPVFIDKKELAKTPADITKLTLKANGGVKEQVVKKGTGIKVAYVTYPRSNAASKTILEKGFSIISKSDSLRKWIVDEGRKVVFIGFSYGAPLILEILARMNIGEFKDDFILDNTQAYIAVNGAIGGSYLADALIGSDALFNAEKYKNVMNIFKPIGWPLRIKTRQEREDLPEGVRSLGHEERKKRIDWYIDKVPTNIKYFSVTSVLPLTEYSRKPWSNVDGFTLFVMALISNQFTIYNDGQVSLHDSLIPDFPHVDDNNKINLGAVKSHHWGVGYRTMNLGKNKYPRLPFYRALARTLKEAGVGK